MEESSVAVCQVYKIQTLIDGGARITLDVGSDAAQLVQELLRGKLLDDPQYYVTMVRYED